MAFADLRTSLQWLKATIFARRFAGNTMNVAIWLPATFLLGLAGLGLCFAFLVACEKI